MSLASDNFVAAMISAATGRKLDTYENFKEKLKEKDYLHPVPINLDSLHQILLMRGPVSKTHDSSKQIKVFVKSLTGKTYSILCSPKEKIEEFKCLIMAAAGTPLDQQRLLFDGKQLEDKLHLDYYKIGDNDVVHLVFRLRGGAECVVYLDDTLRSPKFDYDFTKITDDGIVFKRGGHVYKRPIGTIRLALNVLNRYGDNSWLGTVGRTLQTNDVSDEWPVSYHGTGKHNLESIAEHGYSLSKGVRFLFGNGIYTTPDAAVAMLYAKSFTHENATYKFILQNRVNPKTVKRVSKSVTGYGEYWISEKQEDEV